MRYDDIKMMSQYLCKVSCKAEYNVWQVFLLEKTY